MNPGTFFGELKGRNVYKVANASFGSSLRLRRYMIVTCSEVTVCYTHIALKSYRHLVEGTTKLRSDQDRQIKLTPIQHMKKPRSIHALLPLALAFAMTCANSRVSAADPDPEQIAAINKTAEAFVEAFHKGDAKALAAFWTPDGDYVDENGRVLKGRRPSRIHSWNSSLQTRA